jgi:DNA polymerase elongation subunit (family B)
MLYDLNLEKILFLDIETVPVIYQYDKLSDKQKELWQSKNQYQLKDGITAEELYEKAGIYAEFGQIICISAGYMRKTNSSYELRLKSFYGHDEKILLEEFKKLLDEHYNTESHFLCAHNGKEFDFPYIARRMLINGIKLPVILDIAGRKPWDVRHLDTMELWKFGDYKHYTSLNLLAQIFQIPTPKDDISGADVARVYWEEKNLKRIVTYCEKDVVATVQLLLRYRGEELIPEENIYHIE